MFAVRAIVVGCLFAIALPCVARADDTWTDPYPGVRHLLRTTADPNRIHALEIDLRSTAIRLRATRSEHRGQIVSAFAAQYGCQMAVNADFFTSGFTPNGLAVGTGALWPGVDDGVEESFIAFGLGNQVAISPPADVVGAPEAWMLELVSGRERVTENGAAAEYVSGNPDVAPRTAVGLSADQATLWLVVVDGRTDISVGMTLYQLGGLMADLGADQAINLDGGGSSTLVITGEGGVVNDPSDGSERVVANHLGVAVLAYAGEPGELSHAANDEGVIELELGEARDGWVELRNIGTATWMPGTTKLAPIPRDQPSTIGGPPAWLDAQRVSTVTAAVPPGETGRFALPLAGTALGEHTQGFGLVEEGVTWFADEPSGGGPADGTIAITVHVVEPCVASCTTGDGGDDDTATSDGVANESSASDGDASSDTGEPSIGGEDSPQGCGCRSAPSPAVALVLPWLLLMLARRRDHIGAR